MQPRRASARVWAWTLVLTLAAALLGSGCAGAEPSRADAASEAGGGCVDEPAPEDCARCFENIGRCCYDDPTIGGQRPALTATCEAQPRCARCCNECAARTCEQLRAAGDCPNM